MFGAIYLLRNFSDVTAQLEAVAKRPEEGLVADIAQGICIALLGNAPAFLSVQLAMGLLTFLIAIPRGLAGGALL